MAAAPQQRSARAWLGRLGLGSALAIALIIGCGPPPTSPPAELVTTRRHPPPKPGESITHTMMCSCTKCEPAHCCRELEQDQPEMQKNCADGYDFSKCEMAVSSCDSRCFQHRWRTRVEVGCEASRPDLCCHGQPDR